MAVVPPVLSGVWKLVETTCRHEVRGQEHWDACLRANGRLLVAFWHESVGMAAYYHRTRGFLTLTSQSFDGELAARVVTCFGLQAARGSSSRGGAEALHALRTALDDGACVGFPLDGPRGPRRVAKIGIAALAAHTQTPILPQAFAASRAWRLRNSWDQLPVPKPFAKVITVYGTPIPPPPADASRAELESVRREVEQALNGLHAALNTELAAADGSATPPSR